MKKIVRNYQLTDETFLPLYIHVGIFNMVVLIDIYINTQILKIGLETYKDSKKL